MQTLTLIRPFPQKTRYSKLHGENTLRKIFRINRNVTEIASHLTDTLEECFRKEWDYDVSTEVFRTTVDSVSKLLRELGGENLEECVQERWQSAPETIFGGITGAGTNLEFEEKLERSLSSILDSRSGLRLELGSFDAWPDEKVSEFIGSQGLSGFIRLDYDSQHNVDVVASATHLPFRSNSIDIVHSNSLLEHVAYPHQVLEESYRVLRPGGVFMTAAPFHFVQHRCPRDYLRYTDDFFIDVLGDIGFLDVTIDTTSSKGPYLVAGQLIKGAIANEQAGFSEPGVVHLASMLLLNGLQSIDWTFHGASHWHSTRVFAKKPGSFTPTALNEKYKDLRLPPVQRFEDIWADPISGEPLDLVNGELVGPDKSLWNVTDGVPQLMNFEAAPSIIRGPKNN